MTTTPTTIPFSTLPAIGTELHNGTFIGITTRKNDIHCAVILLANQAEKLTWKKAMNWAAKQDAELPNRTVAALLFANVKDKLKPTWHWTSEEDDASSAWICSFFGGGNQGYDRKSYEGGAVAVRLIPLTA